MLKGSEDAIANWDVIFGLYGKIKRNFTVQGSIHGIISVSFIFKFSNLWIF